MGGPMNPKRFGFLIRSKILSRYIDMPALDYPVDHKSTPAIVWILNHCNFETIAVRRL
jgi:hypothetical protein